MHMKKVTIITYNYLNYNKNNNEISLYADNNVISKRLETTSAGRNMLKK